MQLRGFDDYEVTLGDEMRGQRATLGRTLLDAEADLRIKAHVLRAIEDCDLDAFPNMSVVPGYVRSYARYLEMDPEESYRRFCAESGYHSPATSLGGFKDTRQRKAGTERRGLAGAREFATQGVVAGTDLVRSRFAIRPAPSRLGTRVNFGALLSAVALLALSSGLGYGGYALLKEIQKVGVAPLPQAPEIVAEAPLIAPPPVEDGIVMPPGASAYDTGGALAAVIVPDAPPPLGARRDGPIAAIDPATAGLFARAQPHAAQDAELADEELAEAASPAEDELALPVAPVSLPATPEPLHQDMAPVAPGRIVIYATDEAWIRVRDSKATIFEGTLPAGGSFALPPRIKEPTLRAGNAGAIYLRLGHDLYGPLGRPGEVVRALPLLGEKVTEQLPHASAEALTQIEGAGSVLRAAAD